MSKVLLITMYEPDYIGTRLLASYLKKFNHEIHLLYLKLPNTRQFYNATEKHHGYQNCYKGTVRRSRLDTSPITDQEYELLGVFIKEFCPDIIGISTRSLHDYLIPDLVNIIRQYNKKCIITSGGFGATLNSEFYIKNGIDIVIRGEGEEALLELADAVDNKKDWSMINNATVLRNGTVHHNPMRPQEKNIDIYPAPLYGNEYCTLINNNSIYKNYDHAYNTKIYVTLIGRGCIGKCTYCCGGQWYDKYRKDNKLVFRRRNRTFENVMIELENLDKNHWKYIGFCDEMLAAPVKDIIDFFKWYKNNIGLPFFLYMSYEQCLHNDELFNTLLDSGWQNTGVGLQSGSERLCHELYGRHNTNESYIKYIHKLYENNIKTDIHILGGNCYETEEDFNETLNIIKQLPFDITNPARNSLIIFRLKPHPKTKILTLAPNVIEHPMPAQEWLYRAALCHCRRIMDDETFDSMRKLAFFRNNPDILLTIYRDLLSKLQYEYFKQFTDKYSNKPILVYGAGELYELNKKLFSKCNIIAFFIDPEYIQNRDNIDNIPVYSIDKIVEFDKNYPILIFSALSTMLQARLERKYKIKKERIHTVTTIINREEPQITIDNYAI